MGAVTSPSDRDGVSRIALPVLICLVLATLLVILVKVSSGPIREVSGEQRIGLEASPAAVDQSAASTGMSLPKETATDVPGRRVVGGESEWNEGLSPFVLGGKLLDLTTEPLVDVAIELSVLPQGCASLSQAEWERGIVHRLRVLPKEDGLFLFEALELRYARVALRVLKSGSAVLEKIPIDLRERRTELGTVVLDSPGGILGSVADKWGNPLASIEIYGVQSDTTISYRHEPGKLLGTSDDYGRFEFLELPSGTWRLCATGSSVASDWSEPLEVGRAKIARCSLAVDRALEIEGRLLNSVTGEGIDGHVRFAPLGSNRMLYASSAGGRFMAVGVKPDAKYVYTAHADGYFQNMGANVFEVPSEGGLSAELEIRLVPQPPVSLRVVDIETNLPIAGAMVSWARGARILVNPTLATGCQLLGKTGSDGCFKQESVPGEVGRFLLTAEGYAPRYMDNEYWAPGHGPLVVEMSVGEGVKVTARNAQGGATGVRIDLYDVLWLRQRSEVEDRARWRWMASATTAENGAVNFRGLPRGRYVVTAKDSELPEVVSEDFRTDGQGDTDVQLSLVAGGQIDGVVRLGQTDGKGMLVRVTRSDNDYASYTEITDSSGRFRFENISPGEYKANVVLSGPDAYEREIEVIVRSGDATVVEFHLSERVRVSGTVRINGNPAPDVTVVVSMPTDVAEYRPRNLGSVATETGVEGRFELDGLPAEIVEFTTWMSAGRTSMPLCVGRSRIALSDNVGKRVMLDFYGASLSVVKGEGGRGLRNRVLILKPNEDLGGVPGFGSGMTWEFRSGAESEIRVSHLPEGSYLLFADSDKEARTAFTIERGVGTTVQLQ